MNRALYSVVSGGLAELSRFDTITQNLANSSTTGYKAQQVIFEVKPLQPDPASSSGMTLQSGTAQVVERATVTDFSQGPIEQTGNSLDLALRGEGFFVVSTPEGDRYTRNGSLIVNSEGKLATAAGDPIISDGGELEIPLGKLEIGQDGGLSVDGNQLGRIKVVRFENPERLLHLGGSLFAAGLEQPIDLRPEDVTIVQGSIEGANISAIKTLVDMVETTRAFEAYMRAVDRVDQINGRAISDLGRV